MGLEYALGELSMLPPLITLEVGNPGQEMDLLHGLGRNILPILGLGNFCSEVRKEPERAASDVSTTMTLIAQEKGQCQEERPHSRGGCTFWSLWMMLTPLP